MTDLKGLVRARDLDTSWDAAARQDPKRRDLIAREILRTLHVNGPMSDEQMWAHYEQRRTLAGHLPMTTPQAVRTIRHKLTLAGTVRDTGRRTRTLTGSTATVWQRTRTKKETPAATAIAPRS